MAAIVINQWSIESPNVAPESGGIFDRSCIGARLILKVQYDLSGTLQDGTTPFEVAGTNFYFNPAAFLNVGQEWQPLNQFPINSFFVHLPANTGTFPMTMQSSGAGSEFVTSGTATAVVASATRINLVYDFYFTCDIHGFILNQVVPVENRLTATRFNANQFENAVLSVFNATRSLSWWAALAASDGTFAAVNGAQNIRGNFYNEHVDNKFGAPAFQWLSTSNTPMTGLSQWQDTRYRITLPNPNNLTPLVQIVAWKVTNQQNGTWENSIELVDFMVADAPAGATPYSGFFKQPSSIVADATSVTSFVTIDHTQVDPNAQYYIAWLFSYTDGQDGIQAFIEPVAQQALAPPTLDVIPILDILGYRANYNNATGDIPATISRPNAIVAAGERMETGLFIDRVQYDADVAAAGYGFGFSNDFLRFRLTIKRPASQGGDIIDIIERERAPLGSFPTNDKFFSYDQIGDYFRVKFIGRIPSYTESPNREAWDNFPPLTRIDFDWEFFFVYGDFTVRYTYFTNIFIITTQEGFIDIYNGSNGLPARDICNEEFLVVRVKQASFPTVVGTDFNLLAVLDREPFGNNFGTEAQMREHESFNSTPAFTGNPPFERLESPEMFDVDSDFQTLNGTDKYAFFKIRVADLQEGVRYAVKPIQTLKP